MIIDLNGTYSVKIFGKLKTGDNYMDKILVTGGAGYIGSAITDYLIKLKKDFLVYDSLLFERDYRKPVPFAYGDIGNIKELKKVISSYKPTSIIWLAAVVGDGASKVDPDLTLQSNQESVKWLSENFDGRIVFTSTCSVYGTNDEVVDENSKLNPLSFYATTKVKAEEYLKDKNAVIFRLGTLHGVADTYSRVRLDLVVNILSVKAARGAKLTVFGGQQWRPLLHVKDAAKAVAYASCNIEGRATLPPGIYNLGQKNMTIKEVGEEIKDASDNPVEIEYSEISFEDARNYRVNTDKYDTSPAHVNFKRTVTDGAKEVMQLIADKRIKDPDDPLYHNAKYIRSIFVPKY